MKICTLYDLKWSWVGGESPRSTSYNLSFRLLNPTKIQTSHTEKWITDGSLGWGSSFAKITWCSLSFLRDKMESAARGFWESQNQSNRNVVQYCNLQYFVVYLRSETCFIHDMVVILFELGIVSHAVWYRPSDTDPENMMF